VIEEKHKHHLALPRTAYAFQKHDFFIAYPPTDDINQAVGSQALLPIVTQNVVFIRCSRFLSLILLHPLLLGKFTCVHEVS
jgi:hypothetical protein